VYGHPGRLKYAHEENLRQERIQREIQKMEQAQEEADELRRQARAKSHDLFRLKKMWLPLAPGVAVVRGDDFLDVATFFFECVIRVVTHHEPVERRTAWGLGKTLIARATGLGVDFKDTWYTWPNVQLRVSIHNFCPNPHLERPRGEHPGNSVLRGLKGPHGIALCELLLFVGSTGLGLIDDSYSYWFYCRRGFANGDISKVGRFPFRMVRLHNEKTTTSTPCEVMRLLDLPMGKKREKSLRENGSEQVRVWQVNQINWEDFEHLGDLGHLDDALPDPTDDDEHYSSDEDDTGWDSISEHETIANEEGIPFVALPRPMQRQDMQAENAEEEDPKENDSDISELTDLSEIVRSFETAH
jgi:hypothetical protein